MRRTWLTILAAIALLIGVVWILQGLDLLGESAMSGRPIFALLGAIVVVLDALGLWRLWRARRAA